MAKTKAERLRYRKVSVRMWTDAKFLELSAPKQPNARDLWVWLITGPLTTPVPGIVIGNVLSFAGFLCWPLPQTTACWREITSRGMAFEDVENSLVWLPNALRHNMPESPNSVTSWRAFLNERVPECPLRWRAEAFIERTLAEELRDTKGKGEAFIEAFRKGAPQAFRQGIAEGFAHGIAEGSAPPFGDGSRRPSGDPSRIQETGDQEKYHPLTPSLTGGGRITRRERQAAEADLAAWRRDRAPWGAQAAEAHKRACERSGQPVPPPEFYAGGPQCWHVEPCATDDECVGRIVAERRAREASGLKAVAS